MLRYISFFREKYNRHFITGFGYKLVTELTTCKFTHGISIIEHTSIIFARIQIQFHYDVYSEAGLLGAQSFVLEVNLGRAVETKA